MHLPLVAVAPHRRVRGVRAKGELGATYDWNYPPGSPENSAGILPELRVMELSEALEYVYDTDAHVVQYVIYDQNGEPLEWQPRLNFSSIPWIYSKGYEVKISVLFGDIDNPEHKPWNIDWYELAEEQRRINPWLRTVGHYYSLGGQRVIQELTEPIPLPCAFHIPEMWIDEAKRFGVMLDKHCIDIVRLQRLNRANRNGNRPWSEWLRYIADTLGMVPRNLNEWAKTPVYDPLTLEEYGALGRQRLDGYSVRYGYHVDAPAKQTARRGPRRGPSNVKAIYTLPEEWQARCVQLGVPCSLVPHGERHTFYLHLAGGLCHRKVPLEYIPGIIRGIAFAAGHDGDHHAKTAVDTIRRYSEGLPVSGLRTLQSKYPVVGNKLAELGLRISVKAIKDQQAQATKDANPPSLLDQIRYAMEQEMLCGEQGITGLGAGCGVGKTQAAKNTAYERVLSNPIKKTVKLKLIAGHQIEEITERWPIDARTVISSDKHSLSIQTMKGFAEMGQSAKRIFGAASLKNPDGSYVCSYQPSVAAFSEGGLPPGKYLCGSCERNNHCDAQKGWEGDENAPIILTVHSKLGAAVAEAGKHALTIIDEFPSLLHNELLTEKDFECAIRNITIFDRRYGSAMKPLVKAIHAWISQEFIIPTPYRIDDLVEAITPLIHPDDLLVARAATQTPQSKYAGGDALECARKARTEGDEYDTPPIRMSETAMARKYPSRAREIARAAKVMHTLHQAALGMSSPSKPLVRAEDTKTGGALRVVYPNRELTAVLLRQSRIIITDANIDLHVPQIEAVTGLKPTVKNFVVEDGAPIERFVLPYATANRSVWLPGGLPLWNNGLLHAFARGLDILRTPKLGSNDRPVTNVYVMTFFPIALALKAAIEPTAEQWRESWVDLGFHPDALACSIEKLKPIIEWWGGTIKVGYFGGVRGMNDGQDCDATYTLGDPRPNIGTVDLVAQFLGLKEKDWTDRIARADLEQCHGRLRAIHRKKPGRMLHVGRILPGGYGWNQAVTLDAEPGHMTLPDVMTTEELMFIREKLRLTQDQLSTGLGISDRTLRNYEDGRKIPRGIAMSLRQFYQAMISAQQAAVTPNVYPQSMGN